MDTYDFTITLDREPTDHERDYTLYEATDHGAGSDAAYERAAGQAVLHFTREGTSLGEAIASGLADVNRAGFRAVAVTSADLVSLRDIAIRLAVTYEYARLLATGQRGPGGFPAALSAGDGWTLYSWVQVADWARARLGRSVDVDEHDRIIAAADHLVRARAVAGDSWPQLAPLTTSRVADG